MCILDASGFSEYSSLVAPSATITDTTAVL
jgi:hypothetical protein